jgi:hypothetical protein
MKKEKENTRPGFFLYLLTWIKTARPSKIAIEKTWLESCPAAVSPAIVRGDFTTFIVLDSVPLQEMISSVHFADVVVLDFALRSTVATGIFLNKILIEMWK